MALEIAHARLEVKAADGGDAPAGLTITGIATTPTPDRQGHTLDPLGVTVTNPIALLLYHDQTAPIGSATLGPATLAGIPFTAFIPTISEAGRLKDRTDEARQLIKSGIVRGISIGFRVLEGGLERLKSGLVKLTRVEICELSLVPVPANSEAGVLAIKACDTRAATGAPPLGVSSTSLTVKAAPMKSTIRDQITALESKRGALDARMGELMTKANSDGTTLTDDEATEYEGLQGDLKRVDRDLVFARDLERSQIAAAVVVESKAAPLASARPTSVTVRPNVAPGAVFTRYVMAQLAAKGDTYRAIEYAKHWWSDSTPEVELLLKAAIAPGNTTDATWAGPLVPAVQAVAAEFVALLMPATIVGRIEGLNRVPFNTSVPIEVDGGTYNWVGQGLAKPVTKLGFSSARVDQAKIAGIIAITEELARSSSPAAEGVIRRAMIRGITAFMDSQFIDPAVAPVAGLHPGSITNGIAGTAATGDPFADLATLLGKFSAANIPIEGVTLIMSQTNALNLSMQLTVTGSPAFGSLTSQGGTISGIPVVASEKAGTNIIAVVPQYILFADDGAVTVDVSREASLQMDSAPDNPAVATTVMVSLWQNNLIGFRAERYCSWKRALDPAVQLLTGASYPPIAP